MTIATSRCSSSTRSGVLPVQRKLNAGNAELYGLEIELQAQPSRNFNAFVNASLLHARYKDFTALAAEDYAGNKLVNAPEVAISAGFALTQPLPGDSALQACASTVAFSRKPS